MLNRRDFMWGAATGVGAITLMSAEAVNAAQEPTMSLNVIYPNHEGARFDTSYYRSTHIPLAQLRTATANARAGLSTNNVSMSAVENPRARREGMNVVNTVSNGRIFPPRGSPTLYQPAS